MAVADGNDVHCVKHLFGGSRTENKLRSALTAISMVIDKIKVTLAIIGVLAIFVSLILNYFFSNTITRPIEKLKYETERIANGDLSTHIDIQSNEEINSLVNSFNIMVEKLEHYIQSLNEEKESDENQQKANDIKSSIRESLLEDENGDVLVNGQNPMNAVLNKR